MVTNAVSTGNPAVTISLMAKKPKGGRHVTPRQPVQIPTDWVKIARALAAKQKQPMLWYLLFLLAEAAKEAGMEHPKLPWEEQS